MKRWACILIPILILGSLIAWRLGEKRAELAGQAGQRAARTKAPPLVVLASAEVRDIVHTFEATGSVEAPLNVKIAPKVTGRIEFLQVREGDRVKKGQVLCRIDPMEVQANVQQAQAAVAEAQYRLAQAQLTQDPTNVSINTQVRQQKASVASAQADYNQVSKNYEAQVAAAQASVNDAQARIDNAKAAVKSAKANLDNATTKYNRILGLYKQGFIAAQDVDDAKAAVSVQESAVEIAEGQLKSANAQKENTVQQASIVKTKGRADIEASNARLTQSRASLEYAQANTAQKPAYRQSIAALQASVAAARAGLRSAQARLQDTILVAPMDGFVTSRYVDPGAVAAAGQAILAVQFINQVWVTISVPEEVSAKMHIGQGAKVTLDAYPGKTFEGSIVQVNPSADDQSRQFTARVIMDNKDHQFKPGMFGRVTVETDRIKKAIAVPREAVQRDKMGEFAMMVDRSGAAKRQPIVSGVSDTNFISIDQGLQAGDKIIVMSAFPVREGQIVRVGGRGKPGQRGGHGGERGEQK